MLLVFDLYYFRILYNYCFFCDLQLIQKYHSQKSHHLCLQRQKVKHFTFITAYSYNMSDGKEFFIKNIINRMYKKISKVIIMNLSCEHYSWRTVID